MELGEAEPIWGQGNPQPLIHIVDASVSPGAIRVMGANSDTVRIDINGISYIKFHAKELIEELQNHKTAFKMEIVGKPNLNEWMGKYSPQVFIEDYEIKEDTTFNF
jgi:single-stranded-DNA-specific exonuclease